MKWISIKKCESQLKTKNVYPYNSFLVDFVHLYNFMLKKSQFALFNSFRSFNWFFAPYFSRWSCKLFKLNKFSIGLRPKESAFSRVKKKSPLNLVSKIFSYCLPSYFKIPENCLGQEQSLRNKKNFNLEKCSACSRKLSTNFSLIYCFLPTCISYAVFA